MTTPEPATGLTAALIERIRPLKLMVFDVDGVMTDGRLYYSDDGVESKAFHTQDGQGLALLREAGMKMAIITSRRSALVERRSRELGLHYCYQGVGAKLPTFNELLAELNLDAAQAGYMGDDLLDLPVMTRAGFAATVPDAPAAVRKCAHFAARRPGGRGAVREVCELVMAGQGLLDGLIAGYLK